MDEETTEPSIGLMPDEQPEIVTTAMPVKMADDADVWRTADEPVEEPVYEQAEPEADVVDPNPFPDELPQSMDVNPIEMEMERPTREAIVDYETRKTKWFSDSSNKIHNTVIDYDNFMTGETDEVKDQVVIRSLINLHLGVDPVDVNDYEVNRSILSNKFYGGEGADSDSALMARVRKDSQAKKEHEELHSSLQNEAFVGSLTGKGFNDWVKSQPKMSEPRKKSLLLEYNNYQQQVEEQYGLNLRYASNAYKFLKKNGIGDGLKFLSKVAENLSDEDLAVTMGLFKEAVSIDPDDTIDEMLAEYGLESEILKGVGGSVLRSFRNTRNILEGMKDIGSFPYKHLKQMKAGGEDILDVLKDPIGWSMAGEDQDRIGKEKRKQAVEEEIKSILLNDYSPMTPHFEGGKLGWLEENIYGIPSTVGTMAVAMIPYAGLPLMGSMMYGSSVQKYRQRLLATGNFTLKEAMDVSEDLAGKALPLLVVQEKIQSLGLAGKMPGVSQLSMAINRRINNTWARAGVRGIIGVTGEAGVETGQGWTEEAIQDYASMFNEYIPGVDWKNGKDGVLDGFWTKFLGTMIQVAPAGVSLAVGGLKKEDRAEMWKAMPQETRYMYGASAKDSASVDKAETKADLEAAVESLEKNRDPYSELAKTTVEQAEAQAKMTTKAIADLQRAGVFPIIRTEKDQDGVVDIVDPETGDVLDRIDNNPQATADAVVSFMELQDQANQHQLDELSAMIEAAILDVQQAADPKATVELDLGSKMDVAGLLSEFPEYRDRALSQIDRLNELESREIMNGGDGGMSRAVYGLSRPTYEQDQKSFIQRIFAGTSAMTLVHERGHVLREQAFKSGALTLKEAYDFFIKMDKGLAGKRSRSGEKLRFLPKGTKADDFTAIDEAIAEFNEVLLLSTRNGKKTKMREVVNRQMSAMIKARIPGSAKFKAFYEAMLDFFGKVFARSFYIKQAVKSGVIKESDIEAFRVALQGSAEQEMFESEVAAEAEAIIDDNVPFSIGRSEITPTANTQVFPTADGVVVGEASFSIEAWHGTPHKVDEQEGFSTKMIGTGEGAQAYGYGLYFGGAQKTGEFYRDKFKGEQTFHMESDGKPLGVKIFTPQDVFAARKVEELGVTKARDFFANILSNRETLIDSGVLDDSDILGYESSFEFVNKLPETLTNIKLVEDFDSRLYKVELNVEQDELLDWDKPLSEQSEMVRDAVEKMLSQTAGVPFSKRNILRSLKGDLPSHDGGSFYNTFADNIGGNIQQASKDLASAGIKGIKYLDGTSRKDGEGTYNYVIFDGKDISIKEENGRKVATASFSISPAQDAAYMDAVESGDVETAKDIFDVSAKALAKGRGRGSYSATPDSLMGFKTDKEQTPFDETNYRTEIVVVVGAGTDDAFVDGIKGLNPSHAMERARRNWGTDDVSFVMVGSADPVTYDADGNVIPLSQRFDPSRDEIAFSIGDTRMKDTILDNPILRAKDPMAKAAIMERIIERVTNLKREVPELIRAFGKDVVKKEIVDRRLMGDLRAESAKMRRDAIEEAENAAYERYGEVLSNEDLSDIKAQPVAEFILTEGGLESLSAAKRRLGDDELLGGEYESAAGLPTMFYGGTESPDQMAKLLSDAGMIKDGDVETMIDALDREIISVSSRKSELKKAKKELSASRAKARQTAKEWLDERIAEQKRDYNPMSRARRALVTLSAIRQSLPMELRGKITGDAKMLTMGDEKRLKYLEDTLVKVDKVVEAWIKKEVKAEINKVWDKLKIRKGEKGKLTPDIQDRLTAIKTMSEMSKADVDAAADELTAKLELATEMDEIERLSGELADMNGFGAVNSMNAKQITDFLRNIVTLTKTARTIREINAEQDKLRIDYFDSVLNNDVTGGKGAMGSNKRQKTAYKRDQNKILSGLNKFHRQNISFEWLMNGLARQNKAVGTNESKTHELFATMVHVATHKTKEDNQVTTDKYNDFMSDVFNLDGVALGDHIAKEMMTPVDSGIMKKDYPNGKASTKKTLSASNVKALIEGRARAESLGLTKEDVDAAKARYYEIKTEKQALKKNKGKEAEVADDTPIVIESAVEGKDEEMFMSQSQAIARVMMFRQEGIKESMIKEGYTEDAMAKVEKDFLTDESKIIMEWMSLEYAKNYDVVNEVYRKQYGLNLPMIEFYAPIRRIVDQKTEKELAIDSSGTRAMSSTPGFLNTRVKNYNEIDPNSDALKMFMQHMAQTNHYVNWAQPIKDLRRVFGNKKNRQNIIDYSGKSMLESIDERIEWLADGGNRKANHIPWLDSMRIAHTFTSLSYNIGVGVKQLTSMPAFAFDMPLKDYAKYQAMFFKDFNKNWDEMWKTSYVQTRLKEGFTRDVAEGMKRPGKSSIGRWTMKGLQTGMLVGKYGDIVPVIVGGWAAKKRAYDKARADGMTKADAEAHSTIVFEMASDRAQQAVDMKDLSKWQAGDSLYKLMTMYMTSPRQYYANVAEGILDAASGKKKGWESAVRRMFISNVILPVMFQFVSDSWRMMGDDEKEYEPQEYFRAMILGPLNGLFIAGDIITPLVAALVGAKRWDENLTILAAWNDVARGFETFTSGDFGEGIEETIYQLGRIAPSPISFYSIAKRRIGDFYDWD